jgi:hypothetical protein
MMTDAAGGSGERMQFKAKAEKAYCDALAQLRRTECLGWEAKIKSGTFGKAELDAHVKAGKLLGRHEAFAEAERALAADTLAATPQRSEAAVMDKCPRCGLFQARFDVYRLEQRAWEAPPAAEPAAPPQPDWSPGDVIAADADGAVVLDDGITTHNPERAKAFLAAQPSKHRHFAFNCPDCAAPIPPAAQEEK